MIKRMWMKEPRSLIKSALIGLLVLVGMVVMVPLAFSYLSSTQQQGIAIRLAPASEIWDIHGSFNIDSWKKDNASGISIHNKSPRDLWVFFEYTGDLKQVFKHSEPVLIKAGATQELSFAPLDDKDSPRLLNPLDLIQNYSAASSGKCSAISWKIFNGTVKIHTLNQYASLETPSIGIPGNVLWDLFFSHKLGIDADQYCQQCWETQKASLKSDQETVSTTLNRLAADPKIRQMSGEELEQQGDRALEDTEKVLTESNAYQPATFIEEVMQAVEQIAPGLWKDREQLLKGYSQLKEQLTRLNDLFLAYKEEVKQLKQVILDHENQIHSLQDNITELENSNARLQEQLELKSEVTVPVAVPEASSTDPSGGNPVSETGSSAASSEGAATSGGS